ncbi:AI-2E family transporter [Nocardioides bizhenqiangii]|uniref:AI-2E family transporter n=1 Tax=Nocardioides bizhenqiangii TaxID=3095076 RepID=A0ABZ0ZXP4_9ACTN|nr:AI-2E family transporter [Nocardioides sp. HM61]WQQ28028.1 AI-2E family transporter [Nocardioides sp. HM61]
MTVTAAAIPSRTTRLLIAGAALVVVVAGIKAANDIVAPVMFALALTIVFYPLRARLERRMPSWVASVIVLLAAIVLLLAMSLAIVVSIGRMAQLIPTYASDLDDLVADIGGGLTSMGVGSEQSDAMVDAASADQLTAVATSIFASVLALLSSLFFLVTLLVFLAFDSATVSRLASGAREHRPDMVDALASFAHGTRSYLGVSAVFGLIVAVIDTGLLFVLGVPGAFIWGVLAFVTNFIPNIGFVIGIIPPALIGLLEGGPSMMLSVIVLYSLVNLVIQSFIQPRYVGDAVGLSTSLTFLSLVFWTWILGPVGALLAVPMSLLFRAVLVEADPEGGWRLPLISGQPGETQDEPTVA